MKAMGTPIPHTPEISAIMENLVSPPDRSTPTTNIIDRALNGMRKLNDLNDKEVIVNTYGERLNILGMIDDKKYRAIPMKTPVITAIFISLKASL